jgi:membrane protein DedA with SNARE-associated domain
MRQHEGATASNTRERPLGGALLGIKHFFRARQADAGDLDGLARRARGSASGSLVPAGRFLCAASSAALIKLLFETKRRSCRSEPRRVLEGRAAWKGWDVATWIEGVVQSTGVFGIAFLMLLENIFPPIPSELIMPLAGYSAARGQANIVLIIIAGAVGSIAGAYFWYVVGLWIGEERLKNIADRYGRWLTLSRHDIDKADDWFDEHGHKAVMVGRVIPTVRTLISVPAGLSEMPWKRFLIYTSIGTAVWTTGLALLGYSLGSQYERVGEWIDPISFGVGRTDRARLLLPRHHVPQAAKPRLVGHCLDGGERFWALLVFERRIDLDHRVGVETVEAGAQRQAVRADVADLDPVARVHRFRQPERTRQDVDRIAGRAANLEGHQFGRIAAAPLAGRIGDEARRQGDLARPGIRQ